MKNSILFLATLAFVLTTSAAFGFGSYGSTVNNYCPSTPYTGDCALCHTGSYGSSTPAKDAFLAGNLDYFCPPVDPNTVDDDNDGYTENQGDCNDADAGINPGATEICGDGIDQDCSGADLACPVDPNTVDDDADGYTENQGDCNDADAGINPGAEDICGDGIDQDCSGADAVCAPTEPTCTDADADGFAVEGGDCGPIDCNDAAPAINPGAAERCGDGIDNNCDGLTDGQDTQACPAPPTCTDADADGFYAEADCNTVQDCNDNDNLTFPGAAELCGDSIDNDCDGAVDEGCDVVDNQNGAVLYDNYCATCHNSLENSNVRNESAGEIMEAIEENEGGMSSLNSLTDDQIKLIADELATTSSDDDDDDHGDRGKKKGWSKKDRHND